MGHVAWRGLPGKIRVLFAGGPGAGPLRTLVERGLIGCTWDKAEVTEKGRQFTFIFGNHCNPVLASISLP